MTLLATQNISRAGVTPSYSAVAASDTFVPDSQTFIHVKNAGGSPDSVTVSVLQGDEFDAELAPADELANVNSGLLEILPQRYRVVGGSQVYETAPGEEFEAALLLENEAALIQGGHIERVEKKPAPKKKEK
jgi:hypothetical protein